MVIQSQIERRFLWVSQRGAGRSLIGRVRELAPMR
jgi:hypothetical protein